MICECQQCGTEFKGRRESKYCGKFCKDLALCKPKAHCIMCGKEVKRHGRICCSTDCRGKLQTKVSIEKNTITCTNCSRDIIKRVKVQKENRFGVFCNLKCASEHKVKYYSNKRKRRCKRCNKVMDKRRGALYCNKECATEDSKGRPNIENISENNGMWKGNVVGLNALHLWIRRRKPKPKFCEECKTNSPYDLANISQQYRRDINDFRWLCRRCHMLEDGRILNLRNQRVEG